MVGSMQKRMIFAGLCAAIAATGAAAQVPTAAAIPAPVVPLTPAVAPAAAPAADVSAFYQRFPTTKLWYKNGPDNQAIDRLLVILKRSPFDGLGNGAALASAVEAARASALSGDPTAVAAAERAMSQAWVEYASIIKKPTPGMRYEIPYLAPKNADPFGILITAMAAPSLAAYLDDVANPNVMYSQLRDTAYAEAQSTGIMTPDPRVLSNLERLRSIPNKGRFMVVDSGNQMLTLFENGRQYDQMKVVAGKTEYPTPMIASIMYYIVYNPYWNAPDHLARKIAQNYLSMGDGYLKSRGYQVMRDWTASSEIMPNSEVDWKGIASGKVQARIRQRPSDDNSMGNLKFPFPNALDIFLHDTPHKEYFAKSSRMLSNGCVRLEDARRLGRWLLGTEPQAPNTDAEIQVQLPQGVPIYLTYVTAQVRDGKIAYLSDPYGWDPKVSAGKATGK